MHQNRRHNFALTALLFMVCMALASYSNPAEAARKKSSKSKSTRVTFVKSSSEESRGERAARLKRECKGRPNAGACSGYAY